MILLCTNIYALNNNELKEGSAQSKKIIESFKKQSDNSKENSSITKAMLEANKQNEKNGAKFKESETYKILNNSKAATREEIEKLVNVDVSTNVILETAKLMGNDKISNAVNKMHQENIENNSIENQKDNFTIFYFISRATNLDAVEEFLLLFEKLKKHNENIVARIIFNGYPSFIDNKQSGKIQTSEWFKRQSVDTEYGNFVLDEEAKWTYTLNANLNYEDFKNNQTIRDSVKFQGNNQYTVHVDLKRENEKFGVFVKNNPKGIYEYIKTVDKRTSIKPKSLKIHVHPWAFDYFKLKEVPAYALSYCKKDFRFKGCEHKYLAKGEISLTKFFEIVGDEKEYYKRFYFDLIGAE